MNCFSWLICVVCFLGEAAVADEPRLASKPTTTPTAVPSGQRPGVRPKGSTPNRWRYSFHNGHWWYYRDGNRWAYWNGAGWRDYEPKSYRQWHTKREMDALNAQMARFDARTMAPYLSSSLLGGLDGGPMTLNHGRGYLVAPPFPSSGGTLEIFTPRAYDGRLNPATSAGGYMGGALRGPFGY